MKINNEAFREIEEKGINGIRIVVESEEITEETEEREIGEKSRSECNFNREGMINEENLEGKIEEEDNLFKVNRSCFLFKKTDGVHLMEVPGFEALINIVGEDSIFKQELNDELILRIIADVSDGLIFVVNELSAGEQRLFNKSF